jgi:hypothetical protein
MVPCRQPLGGQKVLGVLANPDAYLQFALTVTMLLYIQKDNSTKQQVMHCIKKTAELNKRFSE